MAEGDKKMARKGEVRPRKQGVDRRIKNKTKTFETGMYDKMEGREIPKTRKSKETEMPVSPAVLGLFLFLVIGSAFFQILNQAQQGGSTVE